MSIIEAAKELFGEMRDATPEEQTSINNLIKDISIPTGINIFDLIETKVQTGIPEENFTCKYCVHCQCKEDSVGGAYCTADIHDWISDINDGSVCCDFDYDDTFERY